MSGEGYLTGEFFMSGDEACAEGAICAGCRLFAGYPITPSTEIAERLELHPNVLYRWRAQILKDGEEVFPGHGKLLESDEEMRRLRRELARVREERDVLKKAIAFFAKESR